MKEDVKGTKVNPELSRRKVAEHDLEQSEEVFKLLVDAVVDYAIFALDQNGYILTWNRGAQRLKGYSATEIIGKHFSTFYTPEDLARNHPQWELKEAIKTGRYEEEGWRVKKDGSRFWANVVISKRVDADGNFLGFSKVTRDLTERKKSEARLKESEERLRLLVSNVQDYAILTLDPEGHVRTWNLGAERIKGYKAYEIIGKHFSSFYTKEDIDSGKPEMELDVAAKVGRFEDEGWRVKKDGSLFWANVIITALYNEDGKLRGFGKVTRDLSDRKKAEEELRVFANNLEKKVEERTRELVKVAASLEKAVKSRDDFLSIASHELKTPLTTLKLQIQMRKRALQKGDTIPPEKLRQMVNDDERQVNRLTHLVDDMLDITRLTAGKLTVRPVKMNLNELVHDVIERFRPQLESLSCELTFNGTDAWGEWDPHRVEQIFINLLTNAMKYGAKKPITVKVESDKSVARLKVCDQGMGIKPEDRERVFLQFERATSANEVSGLGLGLYIVRQIVNAHNGKIWVESELGKGSQFIVELPLLDKIQKA